MSGVGGPIVVTAYPDAGEATAVWNPGAKARSLASKLADKDKPSDEEEAAKGLLALTTKAQQRAYRDTTRPDDGHGLVVNVVRERDPRSVRRARTAVRRYTKANRLEHMRTLTYGEPYCFDRRQLAHDVYDMRRRAVRKGWDFGPYLYVPELHEDRERLHGHLVTSRSWHEVCDGCATDELRPFRTETSARGPLPAAGVECFGCIWTPGFVGLNKSYEEGGRDPAKAAGYASKYLAKDLEVAPPGAQCYGVGQGFQPRKVQLLADDWNEAAGLAIQAFGGEVPESTWSSAETGAWDGPPCMSWTWSLPTTAVSA